MILNTIFLKSCCYYDVESFGWYLTIQFVDNVFCWNVHNRIVMYKMNKEWHFSLKTMEFYMIIYP